MFVAAPQGLGGSNRSLAELLGALEPRVHRVLASPAEGHFFDLVRARGLAEEHLALPLSPRVYKPGFLVAALRLARWARRNRGRVSAIHANAISGLYLSALAGFVGRIPIVVWVHDPVATRWKRLAAPFVRALLGRVLWAAVSETALEVAVGYGLCRPEEVTLVHNPVDPAQVLSPPDLPRGGGGGSLTVAFLGGDSWRKGFDLLPPMIEELSDLGIEWRFYIDRNASPFSAPIWDRLAAMDDLGVSVPGRYPDVGRAYGECDIVLIASRHESFCRVAAEAMLNGLPVVAPRLEPLSDLLGADQAGLLFAPGNWEAAATAIRRLALDPELRERLGREGRVRAARFDPSAVAELMLRQYGLG